MADWKKLPDVKQASWKDLPDVSHQTGASGGPGGSEALAEPPPMPDGPSPDEMAAEEAESKRKMAGAVAGMTGGQNLASLPPEKQDAVNTKSTEGALGEGIALARGVPLTGAHIDELSALLQTWKAGGPEYESKLKDARGAVNDAVSRNPTLPAIGSLAFAPAAPSTALGRIGLGTAIGASEGLGAAPTMKEAPWATLSGAGTGLATSLAGEAMLGGGKYLGGKKDAVVQGARDKAQAAAEKGFASGRGSYGGDVASGSNLLQSAERAVDDIRLPVEARMKAVEWLDSPEALALREQVALANLGRGKDALNRMSSSKAAMEEARAAMSPEAVEAATQARIDDPSALLRRVREIGPKVVLPAIGGAMAGPGGAAAGGLLGAVTGRSATAVRNALADPYAATRILGAGQTALGGAGALTQAATPAISSAAVDKLAPWSSLLNEEERKP